MFAPRQITIVLDSVEDSTSYGENVSDGLPSGCNLAWTVPRPGAALPAAESVPLKVAVVIQNVQDLSTAWSNGLESPPAFDWMGSCPVWSSIIETVVSPPIHGSVIHEGEECISSRRIGGRD